MHYKIIVTVLSIVLLVFVASLALIAIENNKTDVMNVPGTVQTESFGTPVTFFTGQQKTFTDDLHMTLVEINDSRCKPGVVCVWAGEITAQFQITGGTVTQSQEFSLGTTRVKSAVFGGYTFTLDDATLTTATVTITKSGANTCYVGGCSGEICSDRQDIVSTCIYKAEFACYKTATCARQTNGQCGWTQTTELTSCLQGK